MFRIASRRSDERDDTAAPTRIPRRGWFPLIGLWQLGRRSSLVVIPQMCSSFQILWKLALCVCARRVHALIACRNWARRRGLSMGSVADWCHIQPAHMQGRCQAPTGACKTASAVLAYTTIFNHNPVHTAPRTGCRRGTARRLRQQKGQVRPAGIDSGRANCGGRSSIAVAISTPSRPAVSPF